MCFVDLAGMFGVAADLPGNPTTGQPGTGNLGIILHPHPLPLVWPGRCPCLAVSKNLTVANMNTNAVIETEVMTSIQVGSVGLLDRLVHNHLWMKKRRKGR